MTIKHQKEGREYPTDGKDTMTMNDMASYVWDIRPGIDGFTIGRGKRLYRFFNPSTVNPNYACLYEGEDGFVSRPRYIAATQEVTVVYLPK